MMANLKVTQVRSGIGGKENQRQTLRSLKDALSKQLTDEQGTQYVTKLEKDIGTTINEAAFAQVTGASGE